MSTNLPNGWLNILKSPGMSSHDVVAWVRRLLGGKRAPKIGHTGTLDPTASGVLVLALGKATRLARFIEAQEKSYIFEMTFGAATDSLDAEGKIIEETSLLPGKNELLSALPSFIGTISQVPPAFSAVQVNGVRAYRLARQEDQVDLPSREIEITSLKLIDFSPGAPPTALLATTCSKGTYIRSLCADLAKAVGSLAYISFLCRRQVGGFSLEDSCSLEELQDNGLEKYLLALDHPLDQLSPLWLTEDQVQQFCQGQTLPLDDTGNFAYRRVYDNENKVFLGLGRVQENILQPEIVVASPSPRPREK